MIRKIISFEPVKTKSGGDLLTVEEIAKRADVSESTVKRIIQAGYVEPVKIGRIRMIYYRDFLRGAWEYESNKDRPGRKYANAKWED